MIVECDFATVRARQELPPGASLTFEREASRPLVRHILGDSLRAGMYRAVFRIRLYTAPRDAQPSLRVAAGEIVLR